MKNTILVNAFLLAALSGCSRPTPPVDPHAPIVDGKKLTQAEFLERFCADRPVDATCAAVANAKKQDATRGKMPAGW